jgi:hypothetical protein
MNPESGQTDRREFLKIAMGATAVGLALPRQWTRPLVDIVVLPAHANTSGVCETAMTGSPAAATVVVDPTACTFTASSGAAPGTNAFVFSAVDDEYGQCSASDWTIDDLTPLDDMTSFSGGTAYGCTYGMEFTATCTHNTTGAQAVITFEFDNQDALLFSLDFTEGDCAEAPVE